MSIKYLVHGGLAALLMMSAPAWTEEEASVLSLELTGIDAEDPDVLRAELRAASLIAQLEEGEDVNGRDLLSAAQADYATFVEVLYANGYYANVVRIAVDGTEAARINPLAAPDVVSSIDVRIETGRAFRFGETRIAPLAPGDSLPPSFAKDEPARAETVRDATRGAVLRWREAGHPKVDVAGQNISAQHRSARLDVDISLVPGPFARFGDTEVRGESAVRANRIRQIAGLPKGEPYTPDAVKKAASRLRKTGAFRSVQLSEGEAVQPDGTLDMSIEVVDQLPRRFGGGVEISNLNGLTLSGFWLHRNILGGAERLRIEGEAAQIGSQESGADFRLSARFEKPAVFGPDTLFFLEGKLASLDEPDYLEDTASISTGYSTEVSETLTGELGVKLSYSRVTDLFDADEPTRELVLLSLPGALTWDRRNDALDPTDGTFLRLEAEPFVETRESDAGLRFKMDARAYQQLGSTDRVTLAGRLQLGSLLGPEAQSAPPGFLYYSGGGGTVRGQPYQSLDVDYGSETLGGRALGVLSGELRVGITDTLGAVLFSDAGYLSGESDFSGGEWHAGAGVGVRYKTPVGPLRFDIAGPVAGETGEGVQVYIGIGQSF
ncbi:autotransporter assembly complex protein TamA [Primorskyibacter sp. S187A]|uniref:autotransporter assembly complex protein TamA n=1 Tax=Primorskyibacter sp. S187A TaxID=3415130 RepID=UPI003C7DBA26